MKLFGLILLIASAGHLSAQRSDFVDYLLQLQYVTEPLYNHMTGFFAESRSTLSELLTGLNDESVTEVTDGLREVINIRDLTEEEIANVTTTENESCITAAIENWPTLLESVGTEMAQCADEHVESIYTRTEAFHVYIQDQNRVAFNVQNMVLNVFTDLNPLTSADEITPTVEAEIDRLFDEFEETVRPEIEERLQAITELRETVPGIIRECVTTSVQSLETTAEAIRAAVAQC